MTRESLNYIANALLITLFTTIFVLGVLMGLIMLGVSAKYFPSVIAMFMVLNGFMSLGFEVAHKPVLWVFPFVGTGVIILILDSCNLFLNLGSF